MEEMGKPLIDTQLEALRNMARSSPETRTTIEGMLSRMIGFVSCGSAIEHTTADTVRHIIKSRHYRSHCLGADLFADPAWEMLLELYLSVAEGRTISVSALCSAGGVPPTTGLRYLAQLEAHDLAVRRADRGDSRRILVEPTNAAIDGVEKIAAGFTVRTGSAVRH